MADNTIKSEDLNSKETKTTKKAAPKKAAAPKKVAASSEAQGDGKIVIVFESGASYRSNDVAFTRANPIQEVTHEVATRLLELDNFRLADPFEIEDYLKNKED